jgi:hypothetical protein
MVALQSATASLTSAQLEEQAGKAAHVLGTRGVSQGSVFGIAELPLNANSKTDKARLSQMIARQERQERQDQSQLYGQASFRDRGRPASSKAPAAGANAKIYLMTSLWAA